MRIFVGVADAQMTELFRKRHFDEVNFWTPSTAGFRALKPGDLFLFKTHAPDEKIVGGGTFARFAVLPVDLAWHVFGQKNGMRSYEAFAEKIHRYRVKNGIPQENPQIGCIVLTQPFFFEEEEAMEAPADWNRYIVRGKSYDSEEGIGRQLYGEVRARLDRMAGRKEGDSAEEEEFVLGQGAFRVSVIEAYRKRCAVTGERTIPVLDAVHIRPLSEGGANTVDNGILLRSDIKTLFVNGYLTIDKDYTVRVSQRLYRDYGGGESYRELDGKMLTQLPENIVEFPDRKNLEWHRRHIFLGE